MQGGLRVVALVCSRNECSEECLEGDIEVNGRGRRGICLPGGEDCVPVLGFSLGLVGTISRWYLSNQFLPENALVAC